MKVAKERKSSVLASNAVHHRVDSLTSFVALVAIAGSHLFNGVTWLDPVGGLIVSVMVIQAGFGNTCAAIYELVDAGVDDEVKASVRKAANKALAELEKGSETIGKSNRDMVEIRGIQGLKAGQSYLMEVELAVPHDYTMDQMRNVEEVVRQRVGSSVRGVRRVRIKYAAKEEQAMDFADEFIGADVSPRSSPEPEDGANHHGHHDHDHENHPPSATRDMRRRQ